MPRMGLEGLNAGFKLHGADDPWQFMDKADQADAGAGQMGRYPSGRARIDDRLPVALLPEGPQCFAEILCAGKSPLQDEKLAMGFKPLPERAVGAGDCGHITAKALRPDACQVQGMQLRPETFQIMDDQQHLCPRRGQVFWFGRDEV